MNKHLRFRTGLVYLITVFFLFHLVQITLTRNGSQVGDGPSPRTPVGRSAGEGNRSTADPGPKVRNQWPNPNYPAPRNSPTTINGRDYSGHAIDRMQERGYVPSVVENAIRTGKPTAGQTAGETVFIDTVNNLRVVVDSATGRVVTIIPGVK